MPQVNVLDIKAITDEYATLYPPVISVDQAAEIAGVPVGTIYDWSSCGLLDGFKTKRGRHVRFGRDAFVHFTLNQ